MTACTVPPKGWWCSREAGHEGPCAARRKFRIPPSTYFCIYLTIGYLLASVMQHYIPAMNQFGATYYALTWPLWLIEGTTHWHFMPIPAWCFSFS